MNQRVTIDNSLRRYAGGTVLIGGSPLRLLRLSAAGARILDRWIDGATVREDESALLRRLLDAGLVHPLPGPGRFGPREVTLVVPVKDNPAGLARLLAATTDLGDHVVVDDGSASPVTAAKVRHDHSRGPAAARNAGARHARTELVAFLDSDTVPAPGWLDAALPLFDDPVVAAVAPRIRSTPQPTAIGRYETDRCPLDLGPCPAAVRPMSRVSYVPSAALIVRRSVLSEVRFDETLRFGEDVDLVWRIIAGGKTVRYQPESTVWHQPRTTLRGWLRQRFDYGTSAAPLSTRHPGALSCARMSAWSAGAWALAAAGHPLTGLAMAATTTALLPRKLRGVPTSAALGLAAKGHLGAGRLIADAVRRAWWPLALLTRRGRLILLASLLPCIVEAARHGPTWAGLRVLDDLAYGAGVLTGCARHHTLAPVLPQITEWPGRNQ